MIELPKHHEFDYKNIRVLIKPARLVEIEKSLLDMVNIQSQRCTHSIDLPVSRAILQTI